MFLLRMDVDISFFIIKRSSFGAARGDSFLLLQKILQLNKHKNYMKIYRQYTAVYRVILRLSVCACARTYFILHFILMLECAGRLYRNKKTLSLYFLVLRLQLSLLLIVYRFLLLFIHRKCMACKVPSLLCLFSFLFFYFVLQLLTFFSCY